MLRSTKGTALATVDRKKGDALASMDVGYPIIVADLPPRHVMEDVTRLLVAFPQLGMAEHDKIVAMSLCFEALAPFDLPVVLHTLKWLRYNNPRNTPTFVAPPTPQDIREACKKTCNDWTTKICRYYFDPDDSERSLSKPTEPVTSGGLRHLKVVNQRPSLGAPGDPNCIIPLPFICGVLRRYMAQEEYLRNVLEMTDERFEAIPIEGFRTEHREELLKHRNELRAARKKRDEMRAYMKTLTSDQRALRRVVNRLRPNLSEPELRAECSAWLERTQGCRRLHLSGDDHTILRAFDDEKFQIGHYHQLGRKRDPDNPDYYDVDHDILRSDRTLPLFEASKNRASRLSKAWLRFPQRDDLGNSPPLISEPF